MVNLICLLHLIISLNNNESNMTKLDTVNTQDLIFACESMPIFKGTLLQFVQSQIHYPQTAIRDNVEGDVFVSFWVDERGYTIEHTIVRGVRTDLDNEALRIARTIKFEKPAMQNKKPVRVKYTIPVRFKIITGKKKTFFLRL